MPSHFSTIGFALDTQEEFLALAQQIAAQARVMPAKGGKYLQWTGTAGEQVWLQIDQSSSLIGMNPYFVGNSLLRVRLATIVHREDDSILDGAFSGWANPDGESDDSGDYPLVFDTPDFGTYSGLVLPAIAQVQIVAFAHEIAFYDTVDAFYASQADRDPKFASQSFIPIGLFTPTGSDNHPPEATAFLTGHVVETAFKRNSLTGGSYYWALVNSFGGQYDVVIDPTLLSGAPAAGGVLSGTFWLSGRPIRRAGKPGQPGCVVWLHASGDRLLRCLSKPARHAVRQSDEVVEGVPTYDSLIKRDLNASQDAFQTPSLLSWFMTGQEEGQADRARRRAGPHDGSPV
jgi:hypothetical protein